MQPDQNTEKKPICFVIMPISDIEGYEVGHFGRVYEHLLKPAIVAAGYTPIRADDTFKTDYIVIGIIQKIVEYEMVICDFSARNPNVMYELGIRHAYNKPVVLVKDRKTEKVFDIQGLRHTEYDDSLRIDAVSKDVARLTVSIKETATATERDLNSVVQLAGIKAADIPAGQTISADTNLLLAAIGALEKRIWKIEDSTTDDSEHFFINDGIVHFKDGTSAQLGEKLYITGNLVGSLKAINAKDRSLTILEDTGKITLFRSRASRSKGLSEIPF